MNWGHLLVVTMLFSVLLIVTQRIIPKRRQLMRLFVVFLAIVLYVRTPLNTENILAYVIALSVSFLFWLLIGRYNPPLEDDTIKVYGLDD